MSRWLVSIRYTRRSALTKVATIPQTPYSAAGTVNVRVQQFAPLIKKSVRENEGSALPFATQA